MFKKEVFCFDVDIGYILCIFFIVFFLLKKILECKIVKWNGNVEVIFIVFGECMFYGKLLCNFDVIVVIFILINDFSWDIFSCKWVIGKSFYEFVEYCLGIMWGGN